MADIAKQLGISKASVSYALNGNPGVGEETRQRVLDVAAQLGWRPSASARALTGSGVKVVGLALARPTESVATETFFIRFLAGVESLLSRRGWSLLLRIIGDHPHLEVETYRMWWGEGRIDGVILIDERYQDPRIPAIEQLGLPAVLCGGPLPTTTIPCLWTDQNADAAVLVDHLAQLGHRRIAHLSGPREFTHERGRQEGVRASARRHGVTLTTISTGYDPVRAGQQSLRLLDRSDRPTAVIYGNDLMAVTALNALQSHGIRVPEDLSICSWDDSPLTELASTPITSLARNTKAFGESAARMLLDQVAGAEVADERVDASQLRARASSGPAPTS